MSQIKYAKTRKFFVFYDKNDNIQCFGTAEDLVKEGHFKKKSAVLECASKIRGGKRSGAVVALPLVD